MKKSLLLLMLSCNALLLNACAGGGGNTTPPPPPVATHLSVTAPSAAPVAGTPFNVTVSALDASNNVVSTYAGTVHFTSSDKQAALPADSKLTNGTGTFSVTFKTSGPQTFTVADAAGVLTAGNSASVSVSTGPATQFLVSAPASATSGTAFNFTVTAQDALGNTVTGYSGTVHFTSSDSQATLPPNSTLTNGAGTFSVTPKTSGSQTVTATDTMNVLITGASSSINVSASLTITSGPLPDGTVDKAYGPSHGRLGASFFQLTASGGTGSLSWSWAAAPGSSLPPDLDCCDLFLGPIQMRIRIPGAIFGVPTAIGTYQVVVSVTDTGTPPGHGSASYTIVITPPSATHFSVTGPASANAGAAFNFTVTALDASNKTVTGYSGTVQFTSSDARAAVPANSTLTSGTGTFPATLKTVGSQTITATDTATASITGTSNSINTLPGSPQITSGAPPNGTVGVPYQPHSERCTLADPGCFCIPGFPGLICFRSDTGFDLIATGGATPYRWSWAAAPGSSIPPGLFIVNTFNQLASSIQPFNPHPFPCFGTSICGRPTVPGTYHVVVTVTDSESPAVQASTPYTIVINPPPPPVINTTPPSAGAVNLPYSFTFTASNGLPPFTWIETGALPPGLALATDGILSGIPTATGPFPITVNVQDSLGRPAPSQDFTIQIFPHGFKATGSMAAPRASHTTTLLCDLSSPPCNNTKVLVTGGGNSTAELFDPTSGTFAPTGSMGTSRINSTATLLKNAKVLVTGGRDPAGNPLATAELFDPSNGTFSPTGSMGTARFGHTATLLTNGKVLLTGGQGPGPNFDSLASAEIFDPATGIFSPTGSMATGHTNHTATLLKDGRVLVAAGQGPFPNFDVLATAELFDPATGIFSPTGSMGTARTRHAATLLKDGRVLVAGGVGLASAELFDPIAGSFSPTGSMSNTRSDYTATLLNDGTVLVAGGDISNNLSAAELFDPASGSFSLTGSMTTARAFYAATLLANGEVLVTGGLGVAAATAELYQ